jgi:hypothetical protein
MFLTYNKLRDGRPPIKANNTFKKLYTIPQPPPKELFQETLFSVYPDIELRLEFYVSVLQSLVISGEMVFNVCGGSKFMYATMVRCPDPFYERSFVKSHPLRLVVQGCLRTSNVRSYLYVYERTFVFACLRTSVRICLFTNARSYMFVYERAFVFV